MNLPITLQAAAQLEFDEAIAWYEKRSQRQGIYFAEAVNEALALIACHPTCHAVVMDDVRQAILHSYPYSLLYRVRQADIVVIAVFHSSRDPEVWQRRV